MIKLSPRGARKLMAAARKRCTATSTELRNTLMASGIEISARTVRRMLFKRDMKARRPKRKTKITPAMAGKRPDWAKGLKEWSSDDYKKVCFSDESIFKVTEETSQYIQRRPEEEFHISVYNKL